MKKMLFSGLLLLTFLLAACGTSTPAADEPTVLRVGFPPDESPGEIIRKNQPLLDYLQEQTGVDEIEIFVPNNYTAVVEAMANNKLEIAYFGGLTYVQARNRVDVTPIVRGVVDGTPDNFSLIITRADSGIETLDDLRGRTFAFGDVASTSGHLIPRQGLLNEGIDPDIDFSDIVFTGAHDATALAVFEGRVDAGAMNARLFPIMVEKGLIDESQITILWQSEPFADYPWAVRSDLDPDLIEKLTNAFINLDDPELLDLLNTEGYRATTDTDFDNIREAAVNLGFFELEE